MKSMIAMGSNVGDRRSYLQAAIVDLQNMEQIKILRRSCLYETKALLPPNGQDSWNQNFLNAVIEVNWTKSAHELLELLKSVEIAHGRRSARRWAPRELDLDILFFGEQRLQTKNLQVPHPEVANRSFVLDPLRELCSDRVLLEQEISIAELSRKQKASRQALKMGILNLTPDSFSDGGQLLSQANLVQSYNNFEQDRVQIFDIGGYSTRPMAKNVTGDEEFARILPALELYKQKYSNDFFAPKLSVDTFRSEIVRRCLIYGLNIINDVSGCSDLGMIELLLQNPHLDYVLMHSLSVPANPKLILSENIDIISELKNWFEKKAQALQSQGVERHRIIFDPGLGFGKSAKQSWQIIDRFSELQDLNVRLMVGHSRKSFLLEKKPFMTMAERDQMTSEISKDLIKLGADIVRVHHTGLWPQI